MASWPAMAEKPDPERDVLRSLPRTRPTRRSPRRDGARKAEATARVAPEAAQGRRKAAAGDAAPRRKPAGAAGKGADGRARPKAVPRPKLPASGYAAPEPEHRGGSAGAAEIIGTALQAAGELGQIGLTVSRQALRSALRRLPSP